MEWADRITAWFGNSATEKHAYMYQHPPTRYEGNREERMSLRVMKQAIKIISHPQHQIFCEYETLPSGRSLCAKVQIKPIEVNIFQPSCWNLRLNLRQDVSSLKQQTIKFTLLTILTISIKIHPDMIPEKAWGIHVSPLPHIFWA